MKVYQITGWVSWAFMSLLVLFTYFAPKNVSPRVMILLASMGLGIVVLRMLIGFKYRKEIKAARGE